MFCGFFLRSLNFIKSLNEFYKEFKFNVKFHLEALNFLPYLLTKFFLIVYKVNSILLAN